MLKSLIKVRDAVDRLPADKDGTVSFEYVIVAGCIIGAVAAAFNAGAGGGIITTALTNGIASIAALLPGA